MKLSEQYKKLLNESPIDLYIDNFEKSLRVISGQAQAYRGEDFMIKTLIRILKDSLNSVQIEKLLNRDNWK
jgi:hypothetical protein